MEILVENMERHVKNYLEAMNWDGMTYMPCEDCGRNPINDIHHVEPRSKFGSKEKDKQDHISNLIGLCRLCHDCAHGPKSREIKQQHKEIINCRAFQRI